jgi:hypothetical protein
MVFFGVCVLLDLRFRRCSPGQAIAEIEDEFEGEDDYD